MNKKDRIIGAFKSTVKHPIDVIQSNVKRAISKNEHQWKLDICEPCDHKEPDPVFGGFMCNLCLCPLKSLIHSEKGCEKGLW